MVQDRLWGADCYSDNNASDLAELEGPLPLRKIT